MTRSVFIILGLFLLLGAYVLMSGGSKEDLRAGVADQVLSQPVTVKNNTQEEQKIPDRLQVHNSDKKLIKKTNKKTRKRISKARLNSLDTKTKQDSEDPVEDNVDQLSEKEIRKEEERQFIRDFMLSKKAQRKYKHHSEKKKDFSTISGKGTRAMKNKWRKMQKEKEAQAENGREY